MHWILLAQVVFSQPQWVDLPGEPGWKACIHDGRQVGALDLETGEYTYRNPITGAWQGTGEPPIPRPVLNFGVRAEMIGASPKLTRQGKEVDRSALLAEIRKPFVPNQPRLADSMTVPLIACGAMLALLFAIALIGRRWRRS